MTARQASQVPLVRLDPSGSDHHGEAARLRELGPVVRVILPGEVHAWAVTWHQPLEALVKDPRVSKNYRNWTAWKTGQIPPDWPLIGMLAVDNMVTADGDAHRRLRRPVTRTLTARRLQAMRPRIEAIAAAFLDELPSHAGPGGVVDLRPHYAHAIPMQVICELIVGVPDDWQPRIRQYADSIFRTDTPPEQAAATQAARVQMLHDLIALRTREPAGNLASDLIAARRDDPAALSDTELADTLWVLLTAGHETTVSLITNAARAMLTHRWQRRWALGGGEDSWAAVVEETLRQDAPIGNFMARYPTQDIQVAGITIPAGEAILAPYSAVGRDPRQHGRDAHLFDVTRNQRGHLAFGAGAHTCPGAALARLEATIALTALFTRYPHLALAVRAEELEPVASFFSNSVTSLPVHLSPQAKTSRYPRRGWPALPRPFGRKRAATR